LTAAAMIIVFEYEKSNNSDLSAVEMVFTHTSKQQLKTLINKLS